MRVVSAIARARGRRAPTVAGLVPPAALSLGPGGFPARGGGGESIWEPAAPPAHQDKPSPVGELQFMLIGSIPTRLGRKVVAQVRRRVTAPCRLLNERPPGRLPVLPDRGQVDADALLQMLEESPTREGTILVGLTDEDLGTRLFTFIIGQARMEGTAALVSLRRLDPGYYGLQPDRSLIMQRAVLEVLHELGHIVGLGHCPDCACLMSFVAAPESIDVRGESLCPTCAGKASRRLGFLH